MWFRHFGEFSRRRLRCRCGAVVCRAWQTGDFVKVRIVGFDLLGPTSNFAGAARFDQPTRQIVNLGSRLPCHHCKRVYLLGQDRAFERVLLAAQAKGSVDVDLDDLDVGDNLGQTA